MNIKLDKNTEYIITELERSGFEAYAVGGAVRDQLLGREATDCDITTSALPEEVKAVFSSHPVIETGIKHGTVTVLLDRVPYEVTTFRTESAYSDSRHPDSVTFVRDIREDLSRRDFTMNAVAFSPKRGIVDPFGGVADIRSETIRAVGDPAKRFTEDALRILRSIRFASTLGFRLEKSTRNAVSALAHTLSGISPERIYAELKKLLCGINAANVVSEYLPVLKQIISIQDDPNLLSRLPSDHTMRFACLCGTSVGEALTRLRADNATKNTAVLLAESTPIPSESAVLKPYIAALGKENALLISTYRRALYGEDVEHKVEALINSDDCIFLRDLAVNGNDIAQLGIKGKSVGIILSELLASVHRAETENEKAALLKKAKDIDNSLKK